MSKEPLRDYSLRVAPADVITALSTRMAETFGVTLTRTGGVFILTHTATGAWLQKDHTLTLLGAWRTAAYLGNGATPSEPARDATMPRFGNRQSWKNRS